MTLKDLQHKNIAILGLGTENYWLIKYLLKNKVEAELTICSSGEVRQDERYLELSKKKNIKWLNNVTRPGMLDDYDILFRAPGWPIFCPAIQNAIKNRVISNLQFPISKSGVTSLQELKRKREVVLTSPMKLFFDLCPTKNIIGVTGTKGKGTTSSLVYIIIEEYLKTKKKDSGFRRNDGGKRRNDGGKVYLGGNIGIAPFEFLLKLTKTDYVILELSSFQLEDMHVSPHIAVFTNFTPEHLAPADPNNPNYHRTLTDYLRAKLNITLYQRKGDYLIINSNFKFPISKQFPNIKSQIYNKSKAKVIAFDKSDWPSQLPGEHNKENVAAAEVVAQILKIPPEVVARAVAKFKGLEHRLELVAEKAGVKYYDDSFATTPESTIIALKSFEKPIILLAGGADKGADFKALAKEVKKKVKFVILFDGQATPRLKQALLTAGFSSSKIKLTKLMAEAVSIARKQSIEGDIILLSTGCASFGIFKDYKERGNLFKTEVQK